MINQCYGCARNLPLGMGGIHYFPGSPWDQIACTKERYDAERRAWEAHREERAFLREAEKLAEEMTRATDPTWKLIAIPDDELRKMACAFARTVQIALYHNLAEMPE